jgi:putative ABC transport system permease protein
VISGPAFVNLVGQSFWFAWRAIFRRPSLVIAGVLSLMLGSGMNTTMFSVIRAVMIRSLPYPGSDRLVNVQSAGSGLTIAEFQKCQEVSGNVFSSLAAYRGGGDAHLVSGTGQAWVNRLMVTENFLRTLGVGPLLGREFTASETRPGTPGSMILSEPIWRRLFASDPAIVGHIVTVDDKTYEIVGVLPSYFWFPVSFDVLTPLQFSGNLSDLGAETEVVARLRNGVAFRSARQEISSLSSIAVTNGVLGKRSERRKIDIVLFQDALVADRRPILLLLFGATTLVLIMSCANLATLLLVNFAAREKENTIRLALGSSRWHLAVHSSMEILIIVSLGVSCGWCLAYGLLKLFLAKLPFHLPTATVVSMDLGVFAFAAGTIIVIAGLLSCLPVLRTNNINIAGLLNIMGRINGAGSVRNRVRKSVVVAQVALSTALLVVAGLAMRSLYNLHGQNLGFQPEGLLTFETPFASARSQNIEAIARFSATVEQEMKGLPGVRSISSITVLPLSGRMNLPAQRDGHPDMSIGGMEIRIVAPNYFEVMGIPLLEGRTFGNADLNTSPRVILVNDTLKRRWWQDGTPLRDRVIIGRLKGADIFKDVPREVVGVVGDTKTITLQDPPRPTLYLPMTQADAFGIRKLVWIVKGETSLLSEAEVRRIIDRIDPSQRIQKLSTMNEIVASTTIDARFNALLFSIFAGVALSLAIIGLYGLLSYIVAFQSKEIALRLALGAPRMAIVNSFIREGLTLTTIGVALGIAAALLTSRSTASILYGVTSNNLANLLVVAAVFLLVALLASLLPSYRITRVDPAGVLRTE